LKTNRGTLSEAVTFRKVRHKSNFAQVGIHYTYGQLCICSQGNPVEIQTPALGPDRLHDCPASCVIGQQYSSAVSSHCACMIPNENFGARLKNVTIQVLTLFISRVSLKLRNLKLCKAGECLNAISLFQTNSSSHSSFLKSCQGGSPVRPAYCAMTPTDCTAAKASNRPRVQALNP